MHSIMSQPIVRMVHILTWWHGTFGVGIDSVRFKTLGCLTHLQAAIPDLFCLSPVTLQAVLFAGLKLDVPNVIAFHDCISSILRISIYG